MEPTSKTKPSRYFQIAAIALVIAIPVFGLGKFLDSSLQGKTLWDWLNLLLVPLFLAGGFVILSRSQQAAEQRMIPKRGNQFSEKIMRRQRKRLS